MINETFQVIGFPHHLANGYLRIFKVNKSLSLLQPKNENEETLWMMEHGIEILVTQLYTIRTEHCNIYQALG